MMHIHIDELVLESSDAPRLPETLAAQLASALSEHGIDATIATRVSESVTAEVMRSTQR